MSKNSGFKSLVGYTLQLPLALFPSVLLGASLIAVVPAAHALDKKKTGTIGRYSDGRAYRVDDQGYQLTDQIAELEVTIREQEKQITSCEERLERAEKGLPPSARSSSSEDTQSTCAELTTPLELQIQDLRSRLSTGSSATKCDYAAYTAPLQAQISQLQSQLSRAPKTELIEKMSAQSLALKGTIDNERLQLNEKVKNLELERSRSEDLANEVARLNAQLAKKTEELSVRNDRERDLLATIDRLTEGRGTRQAALSSTSGRAMMTGTLDAPELRDDAPKVALSGDAKRQIQTELANIQRMIVKRKDLYDSVRGAKKGVTVGIQPLETSKRVSLDRLRGMAMGPDAGEQAGAVLAGLSEIKAVLQSDIQVLDRLLKHL